MTEAKISVWWGKMGVTRMVEEKEERSNKVQATNKCRNQGKEESWCPLFSEGLPSDFASNSKLAAIASLLNDDNTDGNCDGNSQHSDGNEDQNNAVNCTSDKLPVGKSSNKIQHGNSTVTLPAGGGKAKRKARRQRKAGMPYDKEKHAKTIPCKTASVGEAQLFLNLWKL
ncbi:unnamed protein product [Cylindrotheca closterium]|uniref:Uncharacterized protein n=1 Tax=Cylindrotheca closterium TaxID=2856 RepID=A0AAD2CQM3_9STRA|nr:unnamed protein product [Cylindrotheca closterium]